MDLNEKISILSGLGVLDTTKNLAAGILVSVRNCVVHDVALSKAFQVALNDHANWSPDPRRTGVNVINSAVAQQFEKARLHLMAAAPTFEDAVSQLYDLATKPNSVVETYQEDAATWGDVVTISTRYRFDPTAKSWINEPKQVYEL